MKKGRQYGRRCFRRRCFKDRSTKSSTCYRFSVLGNIRRRIFSTISVSIEISVDGYFKTNIFLRYVIGLQRLQKTEKLATEDGYSKKKETSSGYDTGPSETQKKMTTKNISYPFSVEQRHSLTQRDRLSSNETRNMITLTGCATICSTST